MIAIHKLISRPSPNKILLHPASIASPQLKNRLVVSLSDGIHLIPYDQIVYLKSDGNYTHIHLANGNKMMVSRTLKHFAAQLPTQDFIRIHQRYFVAIHQIARINFSSNGFLFLSDGTELAVSRNGKKRLHLLLE